MRIDLNEYMCEGSYELQGDDFLLTLEHVPPFEIGQELTISVYDENENHLFTSYYRKVQSIDEHTIYAHIDIEPSPQDDMRAALELLGVQP